MPNTSDGSNDCAFDCAGLHRCADRIVFVVTGEPVIGWYMTTKRKTAQRRRVTEAVYKHVRLAARKHGLRSEFAETGDESTLTDPQRSRLVELRAELATPDGVRDALEDHAAKMVLVFEWGIAWLQDKAEAEGPVKAFESPMLGRWFTSAAEARRALESLARVQGRGDGGPSAGDVLDAVRGKADEQGQ